MRAAAIAIVLALVAPAIADDADPVARLKARVIAIDIHANAVRVTANRGTDDGVRAGWRCRVMSARGALLGVSKVDQVARATASCEIHVTMDQAGLAGATVSLESPAWTRMK